LNLDTYLFNQSQKIVRALETFLPKKSERPSSLHEAMRYAVLSGGKRIRPILALASCNAVGGKEKDVLPSACAIELIHSYSLIHDDLPCMDDDDTRRGKPSCHKKFGEALALLAGDALLTLAFQVLSSQDPKNSKRNLEITRGVAEAVGSSGMIGGQVADLEAQGKEVDLPTLEYINIHKTGALIAVSLKCGALAGGGTAQEVQALMRYGQYAGLLFQIVDDILDGEGYAKSIGISEAREEAKRLCGRAKDTLKIFGKKGEPLARIADFVLKRNA